MMSIKPRHTIFIWFGGVLTNTVTEITLQSLQSDQYASGFKLPRSEINKLADQLSLGMISPHSYCDGVIKITNSTLDIITLEELIPRRASLNKSVMNLINSVSGEYEKWLVSDYPESWYQEIASREDLSSMYPAERMIFTSQGDLEKMVPDVFDYLARASGHSLDRCVLIDSKSSRAVEAVRHGLSSIIYVYPDRLKHEFALRGILETEEEVLHPDISKRVDI